MPETTADFNHNQPIYTVSEVSQSIKRTVEDRFGVVRIRGEISGLKIASSGHVYFRLKDDNAVIDGVVWRGTATKMTFKPEDGLEVVCSGKITTFPGKSSYQIVVDSMEPAGAGALMALLEKRRKMLEAEGLFDPKHKKPLPFLPKVIGVVTSPTGAVIRDILHRIEDRFPVRVILWPVAVQGEAAAGQITAAINGFNALTPKGNVPIPDILIVCRGGGSIEDLWAFNEENVIRAAAASRIPLVSAVGHETDTTLLDFVADMRAPTPTAAAEIVVPVRQELWAGCKQLDARLHAAVNQLITIRQDRLTGLARGLPKPMQLLQVASQCVDDWAERLKASLPSMMARKEQELSLLAARLRPQTLMNEMTNLNRRLTDLQHRLGTTLTPLLARKEKELSAIVGRLRPQTLYSEITNLSHKVDDLQTRLGHSWTRYLTQRMERLEAWVSRLESVNFKRVLERGFALVKDGSGKLVTSVAQARASGTLSLTFKDGDVTVTPTK